SCAVTVFLNAASNVLAVKILARHYDDSAPSPIPGRRENAGVPESEYGSLAGPINALEVVVAPTLPAQTSPQKIDECGAKLREQENLDFLPERKAARSTPVCGATQDFTSRRIFLGGRRSDFHEESDTRNYLRISFASSVRTGNTLETSPTMP